MKECINSSQICLLKRTGLDATRQDADVETDSENHHLVNSRFELFK